MKALELLAGRKLEEVTDFDYHFSPNHFNGRFESEGIKFIGKLYDRCGEVVGSFKAAELEEITPLFYLTIDEED